jgi:hypothetical protein
VSSGSLPGNGGNFPIPPTCRTQWWKDVPLGPPDIILGIFEAFKVDSNPNKIDLSVGAYRDELGRPYVLKSVLQAEQNIVDRMPDKLSESDIGSDYFREVTFRLAVGDKLYDRPHASVQVSRFHFRWSFVRLRFDGARTRRHENSRA